VLALGAYERLFWVLAAAAAVVSVAVLLTDPEVSGEETAASRVPSR
jgi:hypothetical protein